ncbi:archaellin/type IV pilin N-terminal domain-containing protein [Halobacterium wangiae]|uniref:archaellin/type IV pilin N-terminal domain-containing protein n=1 Tax=Halobacterium wangiae TaxID=2902623 RepID=UPI001E5AF16A|nr:archaellin/type IV pilin N-terminal domain-containing protein [Halobacterium wangiae]
MFEFITDEDERGQVGIGTLIVFIAMVLVAAIAAGVLINTAGFLQTKSEATGEEASAQVSNRVTVVSAYGNVTESENIDYVNVTVMRAAGAENINLSEATVQWIGPDEAKTLTYNQTLDASSEAGNFTTEAVKGDEEKVLISQDTRINIVMDSSAIDGDALAEGEQAQLTITTQFGSQTEYWVSVPESLANKNVVKL